MSTEEKPIKTEAAEDVVMKTEEAAPASAPTEQVKKEEEAPKAVEEVASSEATPSNTSEEVKKEEGEEGAEEKKEGEEEKPVEVEDPEKEKDDPPHEEGVAYVEPGTVRLNDSDCTFNARLNVNTLLSLQSDGFGLLFGAARSNVGVKQGRYYWECKMLDLPRTLRVGVSCQRDGLYLDDPNSTCFESNGDLINGGETQRQHHKRFVRSDVIGILLNLDHNMKNKNTISLFMNGTRAHAEPVQLPSSWFDTVDDSISMLKPGFELFPTFVTKGSAVEVNFTPQIWKKIPFTVTMLGACKVADIIPGLRKEADNCSPGEVILPIGFDTKAFVEEFLNENVDFMPLTQSSMNTWAEKSGFRKNNGRWAVNCLDSSNKVLPLLMKNGRKYIMSLCDDHNFLPDDRRDIIAKLKHACLVNITAVVDTDNIFEITGSEDVKEMKKFLEKQFYEKIRIPDLVGEEHARFKDAKLSAVKFARRENGKIVIEEENTDLRTKVQDTMDKWRQDCKLKSKVENLKKGNYYRDQMEKFRKLKELTHKSTSAAAQKRITQQREVEKKAREKEEKELAEKAAAERKEAGMEEHEIEEAAKKDAEERAKLDEHDEFPAVMDEFTEEDWMLATLRAELHSIMHAFRIDVNDEERVAFPLIHLDHYYHVYTGRHFDCLQRFNVKTAEELLQLVPEIVTRTQKHMVSDYFMVTDYKPIGEYELLVAHHPEEEGMESWINLAETQRGIRQDRLDAGDENAALKFKYNARQQQMRSVPNGQLKQAANRDSYGSTGNAGQKRGNQRYYAPPEAKRARYNR